jgi:small subunit ribosomal protein S20
MPLTKSAAKRAEQNLVRRDRLLPYRTRMKTMLRKVSDAAKAGEVTQDLLSEAFKAIDIAAKKGIIHGSNADRKKSRMSRLAAGAGKTDPATKPTAKKKPAAKTTKPKAKKAA